MGFKEKKPKQQKFHSAEIIKKKNDSAGEYERGAHTVPFRTTALRGYINVLITAIGRRVSFLKYFHWLLAGEILPLYFAFR